MSLRLNCFALAFLALPVFATACLVDPSAYEVIDGQEQAATAQGTAATGESCLLKPTFRKDKCRPGLVCNAVGSAPGVCHERHGEAQPCDPTFGNTNCRPGLTCKALPNGKGFCMGSGAGACNAANLGLDCRPGYVCMNEQCIESGTEGTPCSIELVENECREGFECVIPRGRSPSDAICTSLKAGGLGASCDRKRGPTCHPNYACEIAAADYWGNIKYECRIPGKPGEWCIGGGCGADPSNPKVSLWCSKKDVRSGQQNSPGVCASTKRLGESCGAGGFNDCGNDPTNVYPFPQLACIRGRCSYPVPPRGACNPNDLNPCGVPNYICKKNTSPGWGKVNAYLCLPTTI